MALAAPWIAPHDSFDQVLDRKLIPPVSGQAIRTRLTCHRDARSTRGARSRCRRARSGCRAGSRPGPGAGPGRGRGRRRLPPSRRRCGDRPRVVGARRRGANESRAAIRGVGIMPRSARPAGEPSFGESHEFGPRSFHSVLQWLPNQTSRGQSRTARDDYGGRREPRRRERDHESACKTPPPEAQRRTFRRHARVGSRPLRAAPP